MLLKQTHNAIRFNTEPVSDVASKWLIVFSLQVFVFQHMYWVTLAVVYITVQSTISIFNFGFILWCFFFLWHGQALYLQPRTRLFKLWKIFIGYNYFTLLAKVCLQVGLDACGTSRPFFRRKVTFMSVSGRSISELCQLYLKPLEFSSPEVERIGVIRRLHRNNSKFPTEWILIGIDNHL